MPSGPFSPFRPYGREFREAMPFSPLLWRLAMPSGPFRPFDSSNSALLLLSVDSDNAPKPFPPDGLEPFGYFRLFGPLLPMVCQAFWAC